MKSLRPPFFFFTSLPTALNLTVQMYFRRSGLLIAGMDSEIERAVKPYNGRSTAAKPKAIFFLLDFLSVPYRQRYTAALSKPTDHHKNPKWNVDLAIVVIVIFFSKKNLDE